MFKHAAEFAIRCSDSVSRRRSMAECILKRQNVFHKVKDALRAVTFDLLVILSAGSLASYKTRKCGVE